MGEGEGEERKRRGEGGGGYQEIIRKVKGMKTFFPIIFLT